MSPIHELTIVFALCRCYKIWEWFLWAWARTHREIATAVEAIKRGATNYLCKPADADDVLAGLLAQHADLDSLVPDNPMSVDRLQWEHIQRVLSEHEGNISATARALGMHRRTLQRKLQKRPVRR